MRDAVIVDAVRTAVGKRGGSLSGLHAASLSGQVLHALAERTGLDPALVDDVIWGCASGSVCRAAASAGRPCWRRAGRSPYPGSPSTASAARRSRPSTRRRRV